MKGKSILPPSGSAPVIGPGRAEVPPPAGPVFTAPPVPQIPAGPAQGLVYDGRLGDIYRIFVVNLLLGLVTLGVYRFWGKTRIRRYLWSHTAYDGDRFEYTGTGGELFRGFLVVAAVFAGIALVLGGAGLAIALVYPDNLMMAELATLGLHSLVYIVGLYLLLAGQYMALRYRLTRTRWRAIRSALDGSPWKYGLAAFAWMLAIGASLGFARPVADVALARWLIRNVFFGTAQARLHAAGDGGGLYVPYVVSWFATVGGVFLFYGVAVGLIAANAPLLHRVLGDGQHGPLVDVEALLGDPEIVGMLWRIAAAMLLAGIPALMAVLIARCWYLTALFRRLGEMTELAGLRPRTTFSTVQLWQLVAGNFLIILFTLGLGSPLVQHRSLRFVAARIELVGTVDGETIGQSPFAAPGRGEGLVEALDAGVGL